MAKTEPPIRTFSIDYTSRGDAPDVTPDSISDVYDALVDVFFAAGLEVLGASDGPYVED